MWFKKRNREQTVCKVAISLHCPQKVGCMLSSGRELASLHHKIPQLVPLHWALLPRLQLPWETPPPSVQRSFTCPCFLWHLGVSLFYWCLYTSVTSLQNMSLELILSTGTWVSSWGEEHKRNSLWFCVFLLTIFHQSPRFIHIYSQILFSFS